MGCMLSKILQQLFTWGSYDFVNFVNLVKLVISREKGAEREDLVHDTAHAPDVHFVAVEAVCEQALGGSVPPSGNILC